MGFLTGEELVVTLAPMAVYWLYSGMYEALGSNSALEKYRLHSRKDEEGKNMASKKDVLKGVLQQQLIQAFISVALIKLTSDQDGSGIIHGVGLEAGVGKAAAAANLLASLLEVVVRFAVAMFIHDAWQYFMHRLMHSNRYMYRRFHSWHHRIVAPYAYAAQYNHPVDGVLTEMLAGTAAFVVSGMSPRTAAVFFVFATIKGIDDHCGMLVPWNPLHVMFDNNVAYHDVHHQLGGGRYNFSQPFFVVWDRWLGTHADYAVEKRHGGGGLQVKRSILKDR